MSGGEALVSSRGALHMGRLPLEGLRVVDSTYIFAMPYAASIMADLGAEVIKIEGPAHTDPIRRGNTSSFPDHDPGEDFWNRAGSFNLLNRGKRSLTLDLSQERGRDVLRQLLKVSDVFLENYTPRVLQRWGLTYPDVSRIKPDIIMVSNTGYGHGNGPWSLYPAQATTQEATHGHAHITGYRGEEPSKAGNAFVDFLACWSALLGVSTALRNRHRTGKGQWVDIGMYQLGTYCTSEYLLDWVANGRLGQRIGNRHPWKAPQGCYRCKGDDDWCVLSIGTDQEWLGLCMAMEQQDLINDPRFMTPLLRAKNHDELDDIISLWTKDFGKYEIMERLQNAGVPAAPIFHNGDYNLSPHYKERGFLEWLAFPEERQMGTRVLMGRPWQLNKTPIRIQRPAAKLGEDNDDILGRLLDIDEITRVEMLADEIISEWPLDAQNVYHLTAEQQERRGTVDFHDPNYKEKLGI